MKYLKRIVYGVFALLFFGSFFFDSNIIETIFTRHISILAIIGLALYDISYSYQKNYLRKHSLSDMKHSILIVSRLAIFGLVMILVSSLQFKYVDYTYSLQEKTCSFYDQYHNLIYSTAYHGECPTVDVIIKTDAYLEIIITDKIETFHEQLSVDEIDYKDITMTTLSEIHVSVNYDNTMLTYTNFRVEQKVIFETTNTIFGHIYIHDQIIDYREGYVFKEANNLIKLNSSYDEIMDYNASEISFDSEDYDIKEYVITEKITVEDYIAYNVSTTTDEEILESKFDFLVLQDQTNNIMLTDYSINYEILDRDDDYGLVADNTSLSYNDTEVELNITKEYEGEGYYSVYIFSPDPEFPILESHHLNHIENGKTTYEGTTEVSTFRRGAKTFYYTDITFTGDFRYNDYDKYHTIEQTSYGFLVIEHDYYSVTFGDFLSNNKTYYVQNPFSYSVLHNRTIYQQQLAIFSSNKNPFYNQFNGVFITIPIYLQKTALD